ncbi:MAG: ABC transporter ATP-binding protein, partial [Oceanospirillales bacterium]
QETVNPVTTSSVAKTTTRKLSYKLQRELDALPAELEAAETKLEALQQVCADPDFYNQDHARVNQTLEALQQQEALLERLMERWVELEAMQE